MSVNKYLGSPTSRRAVGARLLLGAMSNELSDVHLMMIPSSWYRHVSSQQRGRLCDHLRTNISSSKTYKRYPRPSSGISYEVTFDESEGSHP